MDKPPAEGEQPPKKKVPTHAIEAERALNKAKRAHEAAEKKCEETRVALEKLQADLAEQERDKVKKQEAVTEATSCYNALCARKLAAADNVLVPTPSCFDNPAFAAKFAELKGLQATIVEAEQAKEAQDEALDAAAGLAMDTDDADLKESVDELLSKTPEQDKAAAKRALDALVGAHAAKKGKKEHAPRTAGVSVGALASS